MDYFISECYFILDELNQLEDEIDKVEFSLYNNLLRLHGKLDDLFDLYSDLEPQKNDTQIRDSKFSKS